MHHGQFITIFVTFIAGISIVLLQLDTVSDITHIGSQEDKACLVSIWQVAFCALIFLITQWNWTDLTVCYLVYYIFWFFGTAVFVYFKKSDDEAKAVMMGTIYGFSTCILVSLAREYVCAKHRYARFNTFRRYPIPRVVHVNGFGPPNRHI